MKYLTQFVIIMGFTLLGEALQRLIPLPIPASVYGLLLLFAALLGVLLFPRKATAVSPANTEKKCAADYDN